MSAPASERLTLEVFGFEVFFLEEPALVELVLDEFVLDEFVLEEAALDDFVLEEPTLEEPTFEDCVLEEALASLPLRRREGIREVMLSAHPFRNWGHYATALRYPQRPHLLLQC